MIVVVSDVHLGYTQSDQNNFNNFIDSELTKLNENDHLVILGDLLDFWRKTALMQRWSMKQVLAKVL